MPSCPSPERFSDRILAWWESEGRKDLPWQHPRSAYRVWVSEIMLQQTQVATVIPYFARWMARFPDVESLAAASEDEVLALWSGLGYYARARNLHRAAKLCVERFRGNVPDSPDDLMALPGIGQSTANAIISLAFDCPAAILDGNVKRVIARHAGIAGWPGDGKIHKQLWREAEARLPGERAADYSQAMMDLGALVCARRGPDCARCPVNQDCRAHQLGATHRIPAPRPKKDVPQKSLHMLVVVDGEGRILLERRPPGGIWGGLWSLPEGESRAALRNELGLPDRGAGLTEVELPEFEHRLTHLRLRVHPAMLTATGRTTLECPLVKDDADYAWFRPDQWSTLGLPKPVSTLLNEIAT